MSGIQQMMVPKGPTSYQSMSASITVGYGTGVSPPTWQYGYNTTGSIGSVSGESGGTLTSIIAYSSSSEFSNPKTSILFAPTVAGSWDSVTSFTATIGGVTRSDGTRYPFSNLWEWSGDVFGLQGKSGQTLAVLLEGIG